MKKTNMELLLDFLLNAANGSISEQASTIDAILEFLETDGINEMIDVIVENFKCDVDFHSYFKSIDTINKLLELKETDYTKYLEIIHLENILLNILLNMLNMAYTIVLNPKNLEESYFLAIKFKK